MNFFLNYKTEDEKIKNLFLSLKILLVFFKIFVLTLNVHKTVAKFY